MSILLPDPFTAKVMLVSAVIVVCYWALTKVK